MDKNIGKTEKAILKELSNLSQHTVIFIARMCMLQTGNDETVFRFGIRRLYKRGYLTRLEIKPILNSPRFYYQLSSTGLDLCIALGIVK